MSMKIVSDLDKRKQRLTLSCANCKKRKVKCDRKVPCTACSKHGVGDLCNYVENAWNLGDVHEEDSATTGMFRLDIRPQPSQKEVNSSVEIRNELSELRKRMKELEEKLTYESPETVNQNQSIDSVIKGYTSMNDTPGSNSPSFHKGDKFVSGENLLTSLMGNNPYATETETINFYEGYTSTYVHGTSKRVNCGAFSWLTLIRKDEGLNVAWDLMTNILRDQKLKSEEFEVDGPEITKNVEEKFRNKAMLREGYDVLYLYNDARSNRRLSFDGDQHRLNSVHKELLLLEKIEKSLPPQRVIWTLLRFFFSHIYPYMPLIDEVDFRAELTNIIGPEDYRNTRIMPPRIEKKLDIAYIGILLIIMRLSFISLSSRRDPGESYNERERQFLLKHPINSDIMDLGNECLQIFELHQQSNFVILQFAMMMRICRIFSPEDGDGNDGWDSQIFSGVLIHMAYCIGLNRDPDHFPEKIVSKKQANLGRRIWFFLLIIDLIQSYQYGNPLYIDDKYYDTKLPYFEEGNSNILDLSLEQDVHSSHDFFSTYFTNMRHLLECSLSLKGGAVAKELSRLLNNLEVFQLESFGLMSQYFIPLKEDVYTRGFLKTKRCKNQLNLKHLNLTLCYLLFLRYESLGESQLSFFYLKKTIAITCIDFIPYILKLAGDCYRYFGEASEMFLSPIFQSLLHRTIGIYLGILLRVNTSIFKIKNSRHRSKNEYGALCELSKGLEALSHHIITTTSKLSDRYYYAWRIYKSHRICLKLVAGQRLYKTLDVLKPRFEVYSESQVGELISIVNECVFKIATPEANLNGANETKSDRYTDPSSSTSSHLNYSLLIGNDNTTILNSREIDKLWMEMSSKRQKTSQEFFQFTAPTSTELSMSNVFDGTGSKLIEGYDLSATGPIWTDSIEFLDIPNDFFATWEDNFE